MAKLVNPSVPYRRLGYTHTFGIQTAHYDKPLLKLTLVKFLLIEGLYLLIFSINSR